MEMNSRAWWLSLLVAFVLLVIFLKAPFEQDASSLAYSSSEKADVFGAPKRNVWTELSEREAADVQAFVLEAFDHLNLTARPKSSRDNYIFFIETLRPNKTDAAPYLYDVENEINGFVGHVLPERWAKVAISENFVDGPYMVYYRVGPLPISHKTQILPLEYVFNSGRNYVPNPVADFFALSEFGRTVAINISDITKELLDGVVNPEDPDDPNSLEVLPRGSRVDTGGVVLWFQIFRPGLGSNARTLLPQGIYAKVDARSPNVNDWTVGKWWYNGVLYENQDEFRSAVKSPGFEKTPPNLDGPWTDTEDFDAKGRDLPPPLPIQPYGPRYKLDRSERFLSWYGFEFYMSTAQATGVSLFDIRFKGERVMYELGLQEAMAHYAGDDPMAGGQEFLDCFFGMGKSAFELVQGYDCPAYADYMDSEYHQMGETYKLPNSICIFEFTSDYLLSRHTAQHSVTASRNTFLTIRWVATVGNYDYTIDYSFYMDGAIEVKVRASGFIFGAFYANNGEHEYGHRIQEALASSMHDHVINFKADMDIAGPTNDMVRLAIEPVQKSYPWDKPEVNVRNTMHLVEYPVSEEVGLDWPKNSGEFYIVYSAEQRNAWGERKGYRITSGTGMGNTPHLTILNSTTLGDSARWAERDLWVLRRKDVEPRSADPLNYFAPHDPLIDFTKMANHESLDYNETDSDYDGDLVVYFNVGSHHVPHSGDIPNSLMHTSATGVMFVPHNFNDRDPSRSSVQGVRLQLGGHKRSGGFAGIEDVRNGADLVRSRFERRGEKVLAKAHGFGATYEKGVHVPLEALEPDATKYVSSEHGVTDLGFNGSAAGVWYSADV